MDVGYFISELLAQNGNVSVPGLGNFTHTRINGHYNEKEGKLYPPTYSVQFDPQEVDDVTLVQYIADRKNISLASSQYFTDKFINGIKLQAQSTEAPLADLGWFYTQDAQLFFKPNTEVSTDPDFFGYQPVKLHKLGAAPSDTPATSTVNYSAPVAVPVEVDNEPEFEIDEEHEAYLVKQSHKRRRNSILTFVTLAILLTALAVYLVNKYDPSVFNPQASQPKANKTEPVINAKVVPLEDSTAKDTVKTTVKADSIPAADTKAVNDTLAKTPPAANNITTGKHYEILGGAFSTIEEANRTIKNYKTLGIEARILENVPGRKRKITLGTYATLKEAEAARDKILSTKKIRASDTYIQPYNIK